MKCINCGNLCDWNKFGICSDCLKKMDFVNRFARAKSLLWQIKHHAPVVDQEQIEDFFDNEEKIKRKNETG